LYHTNTHPTSTSQTWKPWNHLHTPTTGQLVHNQLCPDTRATG